MAYPSLEQYQEALQHPASVFVDPALKAGSIATGGLGLPKVMCGGFALTYTVTASGRKYAVRCFHKNSPDLEKRYSAISTRLNQLNSTYFLPFEFQQQGIRIAGGVHPVVKMAWSTGQTLGDFVSDNYKRPSALSALRESIRALAEYLEANQIAHGDVQPGNLMVDGGGRSVQLIDYDGMFVPAIAALGASEIGHRNFQHPQRVGKQFTATLDRFSVIAITVALRAIEDEPKLWDETQSDPDSFLFRATDYADPGASPLFQRLLKKAALGKEVNALAAICMSGLDQVPSLADFLAGRNIPQRVVTIRTAPVTPAAYISQYGVLNANDYASFARRIGDMVELIGQVVEVKDGKTKYGRPYVFINFGPWKGNIVKLSIWSTALTSFKGPPLASLVGSWVSVVGLVEPAYVNRKHGYSHISIDISGGHQIKVITPAEAAFRLGGKSAPQKESNRSLLEGLKRGGQAAPRQPASRGRGSASPPPPTVPSGPPPSRNAQILDAMRVKHGGGGLGSSPSTSQPAQKSQPARSGSGIPWWVWLIGFFILLKLFG